MYVDAELDDPLSLRAEAQTNDRSLQIREEVSQSEIKLLREFGLLVTERNI